MSEPDAAQWGDKDRIFMVTGEDENGDHHVFMTDDLQRAVAKYLAMKKTLSNVYGNSGFHELAPPLMN